MTNLVCMPTDVTAALLRIAAVADLDDVNIVRDELARLRRVLEAGADMDDLPYLPPTSETHYTMRRIDD